MPAAADLNRLVLSAQLVERGALRYTPAGLPALDLRLQYAGAATEDGQARQVSLEIKAVALGQITSALAALALGSTGIFAGFLANARNGRDRKSVV